MLSNFDRVPLNPIDNSAANVDGSKRCRRHPAAKLGGCHAGSIDSLSPSAYDFEQRIAAGRARQTGSFVKALTLEAGVVYVCLTRT